ncbi:MAG: anti sigma factor C-terminal domain-containing protein [Clostridium sp.]
MNNNIDDIFSDKLENEIKQRVKADRRNLNKKLLIKATIIALSTLFIIFITIECISNTYISFFSTKDSQKEQLIYRVKNPNEYISSKSYIDTGYFQYRNTYNICKKIGGKAIFAGTINYNGGLFNDPIYGETSGAHTLSINNDIFQRSNTSYGLRELYFAYPYVTYDEIINDFHVLDEISNDKIIEIALSFDKQFTFEDINNLIDKNLITFYWVDNISSENKENKQNSKFKQLVHEDSVVGIHSNNIYGEFMYDTNDRKNDFIDAVQKLKLTNDKDLVSNIDENDIKINGIVVVGTSDELKKLKDMDFIRYVVLGSVVDKY